MGKEASIYTNVYITLLKVNISSNEHLEEKSAPVLETSVDWSKQPEEDLKTRRSLVLAFSVHYVCPCVGENPRLRLKYPENWTLLKLSLIHISEPTRPY